MERFKELKGVLLTSDPSAPDEGVLVGGQNMLKRNSLGMKRRPGFGAFDVESAAAVLHGASITNARATFQFLGEVFGLHDGILTKYDQSDSFDAVTKSLSDAIPTIAELGGYGLIASGLRVMKHDGTASPTPLGSMRIADFESAEAWPDDGGSVNVAVDQSSADYLSGTQALRMVASSAGDETSTLLDIPRVDSYYMWGWGAYSSKPLGLTGGVHYDLGNKVSNLGTRTVTSININVKSVGATVLQGDITVRLQYAGSDGLPDGSDIAAAHTESAATFGSVGDKTITLDTEVPIANNGKDVWVVFDSPYATETGFARIKTYSTSQLAEKADDGSWALTGNTMWMQVSSKPTTGLGISMYLGYPNTSKVIINTKVLADIANIAFGSSTYIRFRVDSSNYYEYLFASADLGDGAWSRLQLARGANDGTDSDFAVVGAPSWTEISSIVIGVSFGSADTIYIDDIYLLHKWAPPESSKVFVADGRAWVADGRKLYYSEKWNPNVFYKDTYMEFPSDVVAVVSAGANVLFLLDRQAWRGLPLSGFPDYKVEKLSPFGCINPKVVAEITYKGQAGAVWISKNTGVMFWSGLGDPIPISLGIDEIFTEGGSNNQNIDYSRSDEIMMFFHPRYKELWIIYPTLFTGETNLKYGWVLDCSSGMWMPQFVWNGTNNLVYATVYRDPNDGLYKVLLTDSAGAVFHEGYVGSTRLSATTSKDGYVDGSTTGAAVKGYVELGYMGGSRADKTDKDSVFHDVHMKYIPGTTSAFAINLDYRVAEKGDETVDQEIYPSEGEVTFGQAWTDIGERSTTPSNADDVIERNVKFPSDVRGHAVGVRVGQVDAGGTVEWELLGVSVDRVPRYGER